jgi:hypothetical protein
MEDIMSFISGSAILLWLISSLVLCYGIVLTGGKIFGIRAGDTTKPATAFILLPVILWAADSAAWGLSFVVLAFFTSGSNLINGAGAKSGLLSFFVLVMVWLVIHTLLMFISWLGFYSIINFEKRKKLFIYFLGINAAAFLLVRFAAVLIY